MKTFGPQSSSQFFFGKQARVNADYPMQLFLNMINNTLWADLPQEVVYSGFK